MSNTPFNLNQSSLAPSSKVTEQEILEHPPGDWTVVNGRGLSSDVDYHVTTLLATINGEEVRLDQTDYNNSYGSGVRPDRIGSTGYHHWNSKHELFDQVARAIESNLSDKADHAATEILNRISESDPKMWEKGPIAGYLGGEFLLGGYRRSFLDRSSLENGSPHGICKVGYIGRIGDNTSILVREMTDGSVKGEVAVSQGDLHKTVELSDTDAREALKVLRALNIDSLKIS